MAITFDSVLNIGPVPNALKYFTYLCFGLSVANWFRSKFYGMYNWFKSWVNGAKYLDPTSTFFKENNARREGDEPEAE